LRMMIRATRQKSERYVIVVHYHVHDK
jgi:hypothetical protein